MSRPFLVSWYRARGTHRVIVKLWLIGASILVLGALMMGLAITTLFGLSESARTAVRVFGWFCVAGGPTITAVGVTRRMIRDEEILVLLRSDGLVYREPPPAPERYVPWQELDVALAADELGRESIELRGADGEPFVISAHFDKPHRELAAEIEDTQRKALMGLLRVR